MPEVHLPRGDGWTWKTTLAEGEVVEEILRAATAGPADLVVMTTQGRRGFLDALRGSTTERNRSSGGLSGTGGPGSGGEGIASLFPYGGRSLTSISWPGS